MLCYITTKASICKLSRSLNIKKEDATLEKEHSISGRPYTEVVIDRSSFTYGMIDHRA